MLHLWLGFTRADAAAPASEMPPPQLPAACLLDERIAGHRIVAYAWPSELAARACASSTTDHHLRIGPLFPTAAQHASIAPRIRIRRRDGRLDALLPPSSVTPLFHTTGPQGFWIGTDPRWLPVPGRTLDPRGFYALMQFGAMPAPFTLWEEIRRLPPGSRTTFAPTGAILGQGSATPQAAEDEPAAAEPGAAGRLAAAAARDEDPDDRAERIGEILDHLLRELCPDQRPVILFSGGVDSGLLAARTARLGWRDALLVCYRLGPHDPQPAWATEMARTLGLRLVIVPELETDWPAALAALPAAYPEPVGDYGTVPGYDLACRVRDLAGDRRTVLDGSGADALFRTFPRLARWRRLYRLPQPLRCAAGRLWSTGRGWCSNRRSARWLAAARTSCGMPFELASMIAENPLAGVAYAAPAAVRREVHAALAHNLSLAFPALAAPLRARALDLLWVVCALTAQKNAPLWLGSKLDLIHPFLHPCLVNTALAWARTSTERGESKSVLKRLLARDVPEALVKQPKRGMTPDLHAVLVQPRVAATLAGAARGAATGAERFVNAPLLERMLRAGAAGEALPHSTYNLLWTACFTMLWLAHNGSRGETA